MPIYIYHIVFYNMYIGLPIIGRQFINHINRSTFKRVILHVFIGVGLLFVVCLVCRTRGTSWSVGSSMR